MSEYCGIRSFDKKVENIRMNLQVQQNYSFYGIVMRYSGGSDVPQYIKKLTD